MNTKDIINHVKTDHKILASYISDAINMGRDVILVYIKSKKPFKQPNWLGASLRDYNAQRDKDRILNEFNNNPGLYGYGLVTGLQPAGYFILCIDIDIDNDCKELARKKYEEFFQRYGISYHLETTLSGRYHIFFAVDKVSDELKKKLIELVSDCEAKKYIYGTEKDGQIEILGLDRHTVTVYDGIINDEKPVLVIPLNVTSLEYILQSLSKFEDEKNGITRGEIDDEVINKLETTFKLMRKYNFIDGWKIESILSGFCVKNQIPDDKIFKIFEAVYGDKYDEQRTEYIIKLTKEKIDKIDLIPGTGSVVRETKRLLRSRLLTDEETKQVKDFLETIERSRKDKDDLELRDYLEGVEKVYLYNSEYKYGARKGKYYEEEYFIEKEDDGDKEVWYVEIESDEPYAIFKKHVIKSKKFVSVKVDIKRIIKDRKRFFEVIINDEIPYTPSSDFKRLDDLVEEIASECADITPEFDMQRFKKYLRLKLKEFRRDRDNRKPCAISKVTGWNDDFSYFYHYDLNNYKHELHKEHTLYRQRKAESFNQEEQHKFVFKLLEEGKLLSVFLTISGSSILLKPLNLQPFTVIITGNPGAGKTTACLIATSLFYKSDEILLTPDTTRVGLELKLASLNSLPFVVDEGALAEDSELLKRLIFGVASKKGRTRGRKDLTVDTKDIISNVFWTSETTDIDEIKRGGAFRRMIHITIESWQDFTELFDINNMSQTPNELYAGCGVDYIKFAIENLDKIRERFNRETKDFGIKYKGITGIAKTLYAGIIFLEEYYKQHYNIVSFTKLRKRVDDLLNEVQDTFQAVKDDVVEAFQEYLYENLNSRFAVFEQVRDGAGGYKYAVDPPKVKEQLGEYDKTNETFYITADGFKVIAKALEKDRKILHNALFNAGVITKEAKSLRSKITKLKTRFYIVNFNKPPEPQPDQQEPPPTEPPQEPQPQPPLQPSPLELPPPEPQQTIDEIDDGIVDFFSRTTYEGKQQKPKQDKEKEKAPQPPQEKKKPPKAKPKAKEATQAQPQPEEQAKDNKITINEDELNIFNVKQREEIPKISIEKKDLPPFDELVVGVLDIETTGLEETDTILAIAFNIYKNGELQTSYRFYLSDYEDNEAKMIDAFLDVLSKSDADLITGYNIYAFDLPRIQGKGLNNRLRFSDQVSIFGAFIKNEIQKGYNIIIDGKEIETIDSFYLVLKYDAIARTIPNQDYKLKSVARFFGISKEDRVILTADEIKEYYKSDRKLFDEYLSEDVREAYMIFMKLAPAYYYLRSIVPFNLTFFDAFRLSTAAIWQKLLTHYYGSDYANKLIADEKKDYAGGLVLANQGLYTNVFKVDVVSLYPHIMLNYHIHSRKDEKKIALALLNEYTKLRLELKKKAKQGDKEADLVQNSLKVLINSLYGYYGTAGFSFNDPQAAALVTAYGRKILKTMIEYIESRNAKIIECDTDGIFYSATNGEEIFKGLKEELNKIGFDVELEYQNCIMYVSDKKNYIIIKQDGGIVKKGSKYAGRDKNKLQTEFVVEYIKRYINDPAKAEAYKQEMLELIKSGKAYDWLKVTKKVSKNETRIILDGLRKGLILEPGSSVVTCAYENFRNGRFTFDSEPEKTYDVDYYVKEFQKIVNEIDSVIRRKQSNE